MVRIPPRLHQFLTRLWTRPAAGRCPRDSWPAATPRAAGPAAPPKAAMCSCAGGVRGRERPSARIEASRLSGALIGAADRQSQIRYWRPRTTIAQPPLRPLSTFGSLSSNTRGAVSNSMLPLRRYLECMHSSRLWSCLLAWRSERKLARHIRILSGNERFPVVSASGRKCCQ
jgi:hypothetical protein